jgi:hypothetical protein
VSLRKNVEGDGHGQICGSPWNFTVGTEENHEGTLDGKPGIYTYAEI